MTRAPWLSAGNRSTARGAWPLGASRSATPARGWLARLSSLGALLAAVGTSSLAGADVPRVPELVPKLQSADARVRAATVLQLGATDADDAVPPLCKSLSDDTEIVRIASATALRRLARASALSCLRERMAIEPAEGPKLQMARAVQSLEARPAAAPPPPAASAYEPPSRPGAKYYVALSPVSSTSDRSASEVEAVVLRAVRARLEEQADFQLAPTRETPEAARKALAGNKKKKGFFLSISVEKFDYSGGNLRTKVNIAVFSYPGKALIAPIGNGATMTGVAPGSHSAEDQLVTALASAAVKQFVANAGNM
jgi:hypothetical protein